MEEYSPYVPDVHFEKIPIKNLVSNQNYQRGLSTGHILRAAEHFDPYQINPVKVSRRDGVNYVFNGQHTIEIVALVSGSRDTPVWCMIYDDLNYEHEADIFANQQKYVKALSPLEVFKANLEAENSDQMIIRDLVTSYGLKIGNKKVPGAICAVSTLESIYGKYGYHVLNRVLRLIVSAWEGDANSFSSCMMNGVAKIVNAFGNDLDDEIFKDRLGAVSVKQLTRMAKDRRPGAMGYAEAILIEYNGKRKSPYTTLAFERLHAREHPMFTGIDDPEEQPTSEKEEEQESVDPFEDSGFMRVLPEGFTFDE